MLPPVTIGATGVAIVVPNGSENSEGNDSSYLPFVANNIRYQQVFGSAQFAVIPSGGAYITRIFLRPDCALNNGSSTYTNIQVSLSTTSKAPDLLSNVFSENVGTNEEVVFGPGNFAHGEPGGGGMCPRMFDTIDNFELDTPFFYNPDRGNLLMEVRLNGVIYSNPGGFANDAVSIIGDSISRAYAASFDQTVATQVDSLGLVTEFQFDPVPSLTNMLTTNAVVITWPVQPKNFVLQWADRLGTNSVWQLYTNQIGGGALYHVLTLTRGSLDQVRFFRLACPSCPPISQPSVSGSGSSAAGSQRIL